MIYEGKEDGGVCSFQPHLLIRGGFWQTVVGSRRQKLFQPPPMKCHKLKVDSRAQLMIFEYPSKNKGLPVILLAHGMGGCSESSYMKRVGARLYEKGYGVFLMNHRGSGLGMGLSDSLWNGGSSEDLSAVVDLILKIRQNTPILIIGFSLSGNILLKYLAEDRLISPYVKKSLAINPPIDLRTASHLLSKKRKNWLFNRYFMKLLYSQSQALAECYPDAFLLPFEPKTILEFDEVYTAPAAGYRDVEEYYYRCSANRMLAAIKQPATILYSSNDPFTPSDVFKLHPSSDYVDLVETKDGGHMGYISRKCSETPDQFWMDYFIMRWVEGKM